jgi:hypothetical protein
MFSLNMAEIEINVPVNHGLSHRVPAIEQMKKEVAAWNKARNEDEKKSIGDLQQKTQRLNLNASIHYLYSDISLVFNPPQKKPLWRQSRACK